MKARTVLTLKKSARLADRYCSTPLEELRQLGLQLSAEERAQQRRAMQRLLAHSRYSHNGRIRQGAVYFLLATPEQGISVLRKLMRDFSNPISYEISFNAFTGLGFQKPPASATERKQFLDLVQWYLSNVPSNRGSAAFAAADLLGAQWRLRASISTLMRVARFGKTPAGRDWAASGLESALRLGWPSSSAARTIRRLVRRVRKSDPGRGRRMIAEVLGSRGKIKVAHDIDP